MNKWKDGQQSSTSSFRRLVGSMHIFANQSTKPEIRRKSQKGPLHCMHLSTSTAVVLNSMESLPLELYFFKCSLIVYLWIQTGQIKLSIKNYCLFSCYCFTTHLLHTWLTIALALANRFSCKKKMHVLYVEDRRLPYNIRSA